MLNFGLALLGPIYIFLYSVQFVRWLHRQGYAGGSVAAAVVSLLSLGVTSLVLWRMFVV